MKMHLISANDATFIISLFLAIKYIYIYGVLKCISAPSTTSCHAVLLHCSASCVPMAIYLSSRLTHGVARNGLNGAVQIPAIGDIYLVTVHALVDIRALICGYQIVGVR